MEWLPSGMIIIIIIIILLPLFEQGITFQYFNSGLPQRWSVSWQLFELQGLGLHENIFWPTDIKYYAWSKHFYDYPVALLISFLFEQTWFYTILDIKTNGMEL